jgi:hypothetical protein
MSLARTWGAVLVAKNGLDAAEPSQEVGQAL